MILSKIPNPLQLCREALNRVESGINSMVANNLDSPCVAHTLLGASRLAAGTRHLSEKSLAAIYRRLALPTRDEVTHVAAAVQRLEDKLDLLLPESAKPARNPHPARTRRPVPQANAESASVTPKAATLKRPARQKAKPKPLLQVQEKDAPKEAGEHVGTA